MKRTASFEKVIFGIILFSLGIFMVLYSKTFPKVQSGGDVITGPSFFPTIIGILIAALGIYPISISLIKKTNIEGETKNSLTAFLKSREFINFSLFILFTAAYPTVTNFFGFFIGAFLFCLILMKTLRARWISAIASSLILIATVYIIFEEIAHIPLPIGIIFTGL